MFVHLFVHSHLDKPLGFCPDDFRFKCGAGANTRATNKTNKQISDDTNMLNYKLWQEQKDYDYQKWQEQNAYNTPAEQRKRYEEAGINPNLVAQQLGSGNSETQASAGTAPQMVAAQMMNPSDEIASQANTLNNIAGGFNSMADTLSQSQLRSAQARQSTTDADIASVELTYRSAQLQATINKLHKEGLLTDEEAESLRIKNRVDAASADADISRRQFESANAEKTGRVLDSQAELNLSTKVYQDLQNDLVKKFGDRKARMEIAKLGSEISVNMANAVLAGEQKKLVYAQCLTEAENKLKVIAETRGLNATASQIEKTAKFVVDKASSDADAAAWRADSEYQDNFRKRQHNNQDFDHGFGEFVHKAVHGTFGR